MKKNNNNYFLLLAAAYILMFSIASMAQPKTFQSTYGGMANEIGNFVQQTLDGGYIICGAKGMPGSIGYYDFSLVKIGTSGNIQWSKSFGDSLNNEQALCVRQMYDGTYIVYGNRSGSANSTAWLINADENGNRKWAVEQQGSNGTRYGYSVVEAPDGGYQTASFDNGAGTSDFFQLQKTDAAGAIQWGPKNIVQGAGAGSSLSLTKDGNYITVGTSDVVYDAVTKNYYSSIRLVKTNTAGTALWTKSFMVNTGTKSNQYLQGFGVHATDDGGYVVCGATTVSSKGGTDIFVLKTNSAGDSLWSKNYGGYANDIALSIKETPGGGFIMTGNTRSFGNGSSDIFILKTAANGDSLWMRTFGGSGLETAGNIEVTGDSGFVVIGTTNSFGSGQGDILMLRTDSEGRVPDATVTTSGTSANFCSGGIITLTAIAGYTYLWSTGETTQSITVNQAGNYSLIVTDSYNNINTSKQITLVDVPSISTTLTAIGTGSFCTGNSVTLIADSLPGYIYQWQANGSHIPGANTRKYTITEDGEYDVIISNVCYTVKSAPFTMAFFPPPPSPAISQVANYLFTDGAGNIKWFLNDMSIQGATGTSFMPFQNGIYTVVVTDVNGCSAASEPYIYTAVAVEENTNAASYIAFPNPAADIFYIDYTLQTITDACFVIYSPEGKEVYREKLTNEKGMLQINTGDFANGLYVSGIETQGAFAGRKVVAVLHR